MHSAIEWLNKEKIKGRKPTLGKVIKLFENDWYVLKLDNVRLKEGEEETDLLRKGYEMLKLYYEVSDGAEIKSAEVPFQVPIVNVATGETLDVPLEGVIDLIEKGDTVVELKTGARQMDALTLSQHLQLTAYSYAYEMLYKKQPALKLVNLVKSKTARIEVFETQRTEEDKQRFFHMAKEVVKGIKAGYFCPHPGWMCAECEYFDVCMKWRG